MDLNYFLIPVLISFGAGTASIIGYLLTVYASGWVKRYSYSIVSLAAGVLLGTAFFHLLPETQHLIGEANYTWLLLGFLIFFVMEALIGFHACREDDKHHHEHKHVFGSVAGASLLFHSLLDGVAIAIGYEISPVIGLVTALAVMVHELPEGIFTFSILSHSGMKKKNIHLWTIAVALATPLGTVLTLLFAPNLSEYSLGVLLAIAAGSFLYISASDLVPESHRSRSIKVSLFLILGLLITFAINNVMPHLHEDGDDHGHEEEVHGDYEDDDHTRDEFTEESS